MLESSVLIKRMQNMNKQMKFCVGVDLVLSFDTKFLSFTANIQLQVSVISLLD